MPTMRDWIARPQELELGEGAENLTHHLDPERLVFIDETAATTKMARLRGRASTRRCKVRNCPLGKASAPS
jgi:hypothetical protein